MASFFILHLGLYLCRIILERTWLNGLYVVNVGKEMRKILPLDGSGSTIWKALDRMVLLSMKTGLILNFLEKIRFIWGTRIGDLHINISQMFSMW